MWRVKLKSQLTVCDLFNWTIYLTLNKCFLFNFIIKIGHWSSGIKKILLFQTNNVEGHLGVFTAFNNIPTPDITLQSDREGQSFYHTFPLLS